MNIHCQDKDYSKFKQMIVVPNLETVIYMHDLIYRPFDLLNHTVDKIPLPKLLKDTWCGETMEEDLGVG